MKGRTALTLGERLEVEAVLEAAFSSLRERRTDLSPLRVRAAVRWGRGLDRTEPPSAVRWSGAIRRLSELSMAVGMSALIFGASLGPAIPPDAAPASPGTQVAGPALPLEQQQQQQDILQTKHEWLEALRARLDAIRTSTINDWLDPTVARPVLRVRTDLPAPRVDDAVRSGLY